jgi:hypothetical protein
MLDWTRLAPAVERAAGTVASNFPAHHDISDIKQELWVWIMENKPTILGILTDSEGTTVALDRLLVKAVNSFLKKEEAAIYGYDEEDSFNYPVSMIQSILEVVFEHEDWQSFATAATQGMPRAKAEPATGGNNLASYADVSRAISSLTDDQYNTLVWRYKYHYTFTQIGVESGITKQGAADRHRAAVNAVQQYLGKRDLADFRRGYSGRTEPRGNAASNARTERDYEG